MGGVQTLMLRRKLVETFSIWKERQSIAAIMIGSYFILSFDVEYIILDGISSLEQHTCVFSVFHALS